MTKIKTISAIALAVSLTSCASLTTGTQQSVSVKTGSVTGAICALENNKGKWYVNGTPGSVTVSRSYNALNVSCRKPGLPASSKAVASHTKGMVFGNLVIGGVLGAGLDIADGAAYDYPAEINVPLRHA